MVLAIRLFAQLVFGQNAGFFDVARKRRVGHEYVKLEVAVLVFGGAQFSEFFPAVAVHVQPVLGLGFFVPAVVVQRVQVQHIGLPVARNQVERAAHAYGFFVKVDGENFFLHIGFATQRLFFCGEQVAFG